MMRVCPLLSHNLRRSEMSLAFVSQRRSIVQACLLFSLVFVQEATGRLSAPKGRKVPIGDHETSSQQQTSEKRLGGDAGVPLKIINASFYEVRENNSTGVSANGLSKGEEETSHILPAQSSSAKNDAGYNAVEWERLGINDAVVDRKKAPEVERLLQASTSQALKTTFIGGARSYGNMFDIYAGKDLAIVGLDIHTSVTSYIYAQLYTKAGSHSGYEYIEGEWTLLGSGDVLGRGGGLPTPLPSSFFPRGGRGIDVAAGDRRAFYVALTTPSMYYSKGYDDRRGAVSAQNSDLAVFAGNGMGYLKFGYPTFFPRVWNGVVHYDVRGWVGGSPSLNSAPIGTLEDGGERELVSTMQGGTRSYGNVFDIRAKKDIIIQGFDIHTTSNQVSVAVLTRTGSYVGRTDSLDGWTMALPRTVLNGRGKGVRTSLPSSTFIPITIEGGSTRAFFVSLSSPDILYSKTSSLSDSGDVLTANADLALLVGAAVGSSEFFDGQKLSLFSPRAWNGAVRYEIARSRTSVQEEEGGSIQQVQQSSLSPEPPTHTAAAPPRRFRSFVSDFAGDNGSFGIMFDVISLREDVIFRGMDVHVNALDPVLVRVWFRAGSFRGYEDEPVGWKPVLPLTRVRGEGYLNPTPLPEDLFHPVKIPAGKIGTFYVTLAEKSLIRYSNWDGLDQPPFVRDDYIAVSKGVGVGSYPFGMTFEGRMWNGVLRYEIISTEEEEQDLRSNEVPLG